MMAQKYTIKGQFDDMKNELSDFYSRNEVQAMAFLIFETVLGYPKSKVLMNMQEQISKDKLETIKEMVFQLKQYKPIQYILGHTCFYGMTFFVNEHVLIPRPETEELVDWIIQDNQDKSLNILDVGTGSGCIAIALAKHLPSCQVFAGDISREALEMSRKNAEYHHVPVSFIEMDITDPWPSLFDNKRPSGRKDSCGFTALDILVSNPPYIPERDKNRLSKNITEYEPDLALFVESNDPMLFYRKILDFAAHALKPAGMIYAEIHENLHAEVEHLFSEYHCRDIQIRKDINGKPRMLKAIGQPEFLDGTNVRGQV